MVRTRLVVRRAVLAFAFVAAVGGRCIAEDAAPAAKPSATRPAGLDDLIVQLGAEDGKVRDAAEAKIVGMGAAAEGAMRELAAKEGADPELRRRAGAVAGAIARAEVTRASRVTLKFKRAPAGKVYQSLYEQAGAKLETWPPGIFERAGRGGGGNVPPVTINLVDVPFWEAMLALEEQAGLWPQDMAEGLILSDMNGGGGPGRRNLVSIHGPFLVMADDSFGARIHQLKVYAEPRLRVVGHGDEADVAQAFDAGDNPIELAPPDPRRRRRDEMRTGGFGGNAWDARLPEPLPRAARFKGTVKALIVTAEKTVEVDGLGKVNNVEKRVGGHRVVVNAMEPVPAQWFITVIVLADPPAPGLIQARVAITDAQGREVPTDGQSGGGGEDRASFSFRLQQPANTGPPAKLRVTLPGETREVEIPFEFNKR